ncbi:hypothetical protein I6A84_44030 [Frankia sp. CNm7]|uniref:Uncharacterized protein n=1 Tax=Frankia nepalensis TaxID=1836974 RepID=A0A937RI26_9ACTN|nr:hypothetical protein [Frankia nepalensis]MBL7495920.1 hypothetical protein [Frankia nepalensis]MBL7513850.1 hypothetical protein [Frankia nepalensis]MBL7524828.1 hypothetical protein [Frankia nepalensis]MBL7632646.1 hypothetical protein [Frankia nepalensis]
MSTDTTNMSPPPLGPEADALDAEIARLCRGAARAAGRTTMPSATSTCSPRISS